jgi:hypothetical protein
MFPPDAMDNYGVDKPDLRFENRICDVSACFRSVSLPFLQKFSGKLFLELPSAVSYGNIQGCFPFGLISAADPHGLRVPDQHLKAQETHNFLLQKQ